MRVLVASVLLLTAFVPFAPSAQAATHTLTATNFEFTPADLTVALGDTVNIVSGSGTHNWVRDDATDSCNLPCTRTFNVEETVAYHCGIHPSMTGVIRIGTAPSISIDSPSPGATLSGTVQVSGSASHVSADIASVSVRLGGETPVQATLSGSGTSVTWTAQLPTTGAANGAHTLKAVAFTDTGFSSEASIPVTIDNPISLDMVLATAGAQSTALTTNTISFSVRNDGNAVATAVLVRAEYRYHGTWRLIGERTLASIASGATTTSNIAWTPSTPHVGSFDVRVTVDPTALLPDPDRTNNARTVRAGWFTTAVAGIVLTDP